jgi:hypothetical protein
MTVWTMLRTILRCSIPGGFMISRGSLVHILDPRGLEQSVGNVP